MLTGLEINLQIALVALGLATVIGIYLYSRFRDKSIANSKSDPSIMDEYEDASSPCLTDDLHDTNHEVPDYIAGIDSREEPASDSIEVSQYESGHFQNNENDYSENMESNPSEYQQHQPMHRSEMNSHAEDESEAPVLVEQIDLEEMFDDLTEETTENYRLDDPNNPYVTESSREFAAQEEPEMTAASAHDENDCRDEDSGEIAVGLPGSTERRIDLPEKQDTRKRKFKGFELFNRFRKTESNSDMDQEIEGQHDFEYDHDLGNSDVGSTKIIGEYGEFEPPHGGIHENLEEITQPRFEYPQIRGFNRLGQIDYWVRFQGGSELDKETLETLYIELFNSLQSPTLLYGMRTTDREWINVLNQPNHTCFATFIVSLQLVDSSGAISRNELDRFTDRITQFSKKLGKDVTFMAPLESALEQATALSQCVKLFDSSSMVFVVPDKAGHKIHGQEIDLCASQLGLEAYKTNYYVRTTRIKQKQILLYGVANMSDEGTFDFENMVTLNSPGLVFFFRPIFHQAPGSVFSEMVSTAKSFAGRIGAKAITPKGEELTVSMTTEIRAQIEKRAREMAACGLKCGGDTILRIFESEIYASD